MALPKWIVDHINLYKTDPAKAHLWDSSRGGGTGLLPTLLLTTKGRKSGEGNFDSADLLALRSSVRGDSVERRGAGPSGLVQESPRRSDVPYPGEHGRLYRRARTAAGDERAKLWAQLQKIFPPYDEYQRAAKNREIPVVVLEPQS